MSVIASPTHVKNCVVLLEADGFSCVPVLVAGGDAGLGSTHLWAMPCLSTELCASCLPGASFISHDNRSDLCGRQGAQAFLRLYFQVVFFNCVIRGRFVGCRRGGRTIREAGCALPRRRKSNELVVPFLRSASAVAEPQQRVVSLGLNLTFIRRQNGYSISDSCTYLFMRSNSGFPYPTKSKRNPCCT